MKETTDTVCPLCSIIISPADPERVKRGGIIYHHGCLKKTTQPINRVVQQWFRFDQGLYVN